MIYYINSIMSGSIVQLLSKDAKDSFLTKRPEVTFFMKKAKQHTPFSIDTIEETFNKTPNFSDETFCQLSKYGDLINGMILKIVLPSVHISNVSDKAFIPDYSALNMVSNNYTLNITNTLMQKRYALTFFQNAI